jgi:hypothetical protein
LHDGFNVIGGFLKDVLVPVLWNSYELLLFRFRLWKNFGFGSVPYLAQFFKTKSLYKILHLMLEASLFPKKFTSHFVFHFTFGPEPDPEVKFIPLSLPLRRKKFRFRFHSTAWYLLELNSGV